MPVVTLPPVLATGNVLRDFSELLPATPCFVRHSMFECHDLAVALTQDHLESVPRFPRKQCSLVYGSQDLSWLLIHLEEICLRM